MASLKVEKPAEKPTRSQSAEQLKPRKPGGTTPRAPASKPAPKKTEQKSQPKKKASGK